jgi:3-isopropylmalate/(R)-2-methylmalate dehydratase large subunit
MQLNMVFHWGWVVKRNRACSRSWKRNHFGIIGDSHTSQHTELLRDCWVGTSEVEMVLATQCIMQPNKKMRINVNGTLSKGGTKMWHISSLKLYIWRNGYFAEYGQRIWRNMEGRMTVCNLTIEMGARGGTWFSWPKHLISLKGDYTLKETNGWTKAVNYWKTLKQIERCNFLIAK